MQLETRCRYQPTQEPALMLALLSLLLFGGFSSAQRVAPGVPPQHYQQPPVQQHPPQQQQQQYQQQQQMHHAPGVAPQHYQQPQQQYQQVPVQQQQPPQYQQQQAQPQFQQQQQPQAQFQQQPPIQQQQQAPIPQQQQPIGNDPHQQPHHAHHGGHQQVLNTGNIQEERAHIQEHMQVPIDTSKMSEAELQFHYFKMHDSDNNNKLDGCELIKSLIHWHVTDVHKDATNQQAQEQPAEDSEEKSGKIYSDESLSDIIDYVLKQMDENNDGYVDYTEYRKKGAEEENEENP